MSPSTDASPPGHVGVGAAEALAPALLTDFYQLTMLRAYWERGMEETAVFEFYVRQLPKPRNFLIAAGLAQLVDYLETLRVDAPALEWLESTGRFAPDFVRRLAQLRFTGDVDAMPEGTVFFADQPVVRVTAPLPEAQFIESRLINLLHLQTMIASKAARCVLVADGRPLVDFGLRRAHGAEAGAMAARAAYLAGFHGTATVEAGRRFEIPLYGTMAHAFVQAHRSEIDAFRHFVECFPDDNTLLIDTYDTLQGARTAVALAQELRPLGGRIGSVRIDSGDLVQASRDVRRILDEGGCQDIGIFLSGNLDEFVIADLVARGVPVDGFGVGTRLDVSADAPTLDCVYKLQEYAGRATRKRSVGKATWPGRKQIERHRDPQGLLSRDEVVLDEESARGERLLLPVMRNGRRVGPLPTLAVAREQAQRELASLPSRLRSLEPRGAFTVEISAGIRALAQQVDRS
jgi:nicotinate phosphoribosyltransferase